MIAAQGHSDKVNIKYQRRKKTTASKLVPVYTDIARKIRHLYACYVFINPNELSLFLLFSAMY